jgi:DNA-binding transcriptional ArsR family regulator
MSSDTGQAIAWAREAMATYGRPNLDGTCTIAMTHAQLSAASGWSAASGTVAAYLNALGPEVVLRRRGGIVLDPRALADLERGSGPADLPPRTLQVAKVLSLQLGRPGPHGTELFVDDETGSRPATAADMATLLDLSPSTVSRHLSRLQQAGRLRRRGRRWIFPLVEAGEPALHVPIRDDVRAVLHEAAKHLELAEVAMGEGADYLAVLQPFPDDPAVLALAQRMRSMARDARALADELGYTPWGRCLVDWGVEGVLYGPSALRQEPRS